jgi:pSer/pThr/pTyr-binding forkhead associated (FHA) protein
MKISLVVLNAGKAEGQAVPVNLAQFTIGRDPQCSLRPASALISKRHCAILVRGGEVFLRDFDSTNGTFLNEEPVKGEVPLKNNDRLRVGPLEFKVAIEATKVVQAKAKEPAKPASAALTPTKVPSNTTADDDIAAMLLSLPGEEDSTEAASADGAAVPSGSTVMDLMVPKDAIAPSDTVHPDKDATTPSGTPKPDNKKAEKKEDKKVDPAHVAAKAILDKYSRRGR